MGGGSGPPVPTYEQLTKAVVLLTHTTRKLNARLSALEQIVASRTFTHAPTPRELVYVPRGSAVWLGPIETLDMTLAQAAGAGL